MKTTNPILPLGYSGLPAGTLVNAVTCLEMRARPVLAAAPVIDGLVLTRVTTVDLDAYRALFRRIGADFLWSSRLEMTDQRLDEVLSNPRLEVYELHGPDGAIGLLELDFSVESECEIAFFGLVAEAVGNGAGWFLMHAALTRAWRPGIDRVWVHTCNFDHPKALAFYRRAGFVPYAFLVEVIDDPRLSGVLPRTAAPQVPLLEPPGGAFA